MVVAGNRVAENRSGKKRLDSCGIYRTDSDRVGPLVPKARLSDKSMPRGGGLPGEIDAVHPLPVLLQDGAVRGREDGLRAPDHLDVVGIDVRDVPLPGARLRVVLGLVKGTVVTEVRPNGQ